MLYENAEFSSEFVRCLQTSRDRRPRHDNLPRVPMRQAKIDFGLIRAPGNACSQNYGRNLVCVERPLQVMLLYLRWDCMISAPYF